MEAPLQLQLVKSELTVMKLMYPHSGITAATIEVTAPRYLQDCLGEGMSAKDFAEACSLARRNGTMFPSVGNIVKAHRDLMASVRVSKKPKLSLPPRFSDADRERSKKHIKKILDMVSYGKNAKSA